MIHLFFCDSSTNETSSFAPIFPQNDRYQRFDDFDIDSAIPKNQKLVLSLSSASYFHLKHKQCRWKHVFIEVLTSLTKFLGHFVYGVSSLTILFSESSINSLCFTVLFTILDCFPSISLHLSFLYPLHNLHTLSPFHRWLESKLPSATSAGPSAKKTRRRRISGESLTSELMCKTRSIGGKTFALSASAVVLRLWSLETRKVFLSSSFVESSRRWDGDLLYR